MPFSLTPPCPAPLVRLSLAVAASGAVDTFGSASRTQTLVLSYLTGGQREAGERLGLPSEGRGGHVWRNRGNSWLCAPEATLPGRRRARGSSDRVLADSRDTGDRVSDQPRLIPEPEAQGPRRKTTDLEEAFS